MDIEEKQRLQNEVEILKNIVKIINFLIFYIKNQDHPNIIKVFEFFEDDKSFYIVTELCTGGELFDRVVEQVHLDELEAANIMQQILSAIFYCHKNKIVHR